MSKTTSAPRAYSYLRFSTPEQSKGDSLRRQTALADEYAKRYGLALDTELNLKDLGVSAYRGDNAAVGALGAFRRAVNDGLVPKGSFLLVEALDRISRQTARKAVRILEEIVESGIILVTLNDGKRYTEDTLDGPDFLLAILLLMRGNEESATKAKRLKAAWEAKRARAAKGEILSTRVPAWIRTEGSAAKDLRNAKFSLIPERAALVRRMFKMYTAGAGRQIIAEAFNQERIPTWSAGKGHKAAVIWHKSYIWKILTNPAVTGRFTPHIESHEGGKFTRTPQEPILDYYPRVIDDETFNRAQRLVKTRRTSMRSAAIASIVAGLAKCPKCGSTMTRVMKGDESKAGKPKLVCTKAKAGAGCDYVSVPLAHVERAMIKGASQLGRPPLADEDLSASVQGLHDELIELEGTIESLVDQIEKSPSAALTKRLAAREAEAEALKIELSKMRELAAAAESKVIKHRAKRLADLLRAEPIAVPEVNAALRECVNSVVIDHCTSELHFDWRHGAKSSLRYAWPEFEIVD